MSRSLRIAKSVSFAAALTLCVILCGVAIGVVSGRTLGDLMTSDILAHIALAIASAVISTLAMYLQPARLGSKVLKNFLMLATAMSAFLLAGSLFQNLARGSTGTIDLEFVCLASAIAGFVGAVTLHLTGRGQASG